MRRLIVPLTLVVVAAVVFGGWYLTRTTTPSGGANISDLRPQAARRAGGGSFEMTSSEGRKGVPWDRVASAWVIGADETPNYGKVSRTVAELGGLCFGRTPESSNTLRTKEKVRQLVLELPRMSAEEKDNLAAFFRETKDPALKFWLVRAFSLAAGDPFAEPVAEYYESDRTLVAEALQYMAGRTPRAVAALDNLYQSALDPVERENLIARMSFVGASEAEKPLMRAFEVGGSDRRAAINGLAALRSDEAEGKIWEVIDGEEEEAVYPAIARGPETESLRDLRAHAVKALFLKGGEAAAEKLFARLREDEGDEQVRRYIREFVKLHPTEKLVPSVVDHLLKKGVLEAPLFHYLAARSKPDQVDLIAQLQSLNLSDGEREQLTRLVGALR
jgi:hypothetical protein